VSKQRIVAARHARTGPHCNHQKHAERLNDLWTEWIKLALELELEAIVRRQFGEHSYSDMNSGVVRWYDALRLHCGKGSDGLAFLRSGLWSLAGRRLERPKLFLLDTAGRSRQTASSGMYGHLVYSFCCVLTGRLSLKLKRCYR
jgi:hypothetical protein